MKSRRFVVTCTGSLVAAVLLGLLGPGAAAQIAPGIPASVVPLSVPQYLESWPSVDYGDPADPDDTVAGTTQWRVVQQTGNCCENYVTTNKDGRIYDFGGTYINYSDDLGVTWKQVQPVTPLVSGEGTIAMAPNGDVIGVGWDPYSGDHLQSFKYEAATGQWTHMELPLHVPFFDREWVSVIPGPVTVGPVTAPYVSFLKGAWPSKEVWYYSLDGLNYALLTSKMAERLVTETTATWLDQQADPAADWYQPNTNSGMVPLQGGRLIAAPDFPDITGDWSIFDPESQTWSVFEFPDGTRPSGVYQVDSVGRLHNVNWSAASLTYSISADGGRTWATEEIELPESIVVENIDFRANKAVGIAAVAIHGHNSATPADQDLVYKLDITTDQPALSDFYFVGRGDLDGSSGLGAAVRFDFETVAILPDGRVALSFYDSRNIQPALAIEDITTPQQP